MADLQAMILANHKKFMDAYNANDMDALSKLYTEDCKLMPTGFDTMVGHEGEASTALQASRLRNSRIKIIIVRRLHLKVNYTQSQSSALSVALGCEDSCFASIFALR